MTGPRNLVVVVDDDASVRRGLQRLLRSVGYAVDTFASARDFLDRGDYDRAACLVLDVRMPGLSGLDLLQILVANDYDIPIVFITGHSDMPMAIQAKLARAMDFIAKPFDDDVFLEAVRAAAVKPRRGRRPDADGV